MSTIRSILGSALTLFVMLLVKGFVLVVNGLFSIVVGLVAILLAPIFGLVDACLLSVLVAKGHTVEDIWASRVAASRKRAKRSAHSSLERAAQRILERSVEHSSRA